MQNQFIKCPYCKKDIPLNEAISSQMREELSKEYENKLKEKDTEIEEKETALKLRENNIEKAEKSIEKEIEDKIKEKTKEIEIKAKEKAIQEASSELVDLKSLLEEKDNKLKEANKAELELRKEKRKLEERELNIELELARKLDEEKGKVRDSAINSVREEYELKAKDKDKRINDMKKTIEELKRKSEQGSQQAQGEVLELELEGILNSNFPQDNIKPVQKGKEGADVIQEIINTSGHQCGSIIWESKRTKTWSDNWIDKLKEDQREAKADVAVIVSIALPKDFKGLSSINGVWVIGCELIYGLASVLRSNLIQLYSARMASIGKGEKMEIIYNYLSGSEFKNKVEGIMEAFIGLQEDLNHEKRSMNSIWSKRQRLLDKVINKTSAMYGDIQGIIGASMPQIESLDLKSLPSGKELPDEEDN